MEENIEYGGAGAPAPLLFFRIKVMVKNRNYGILMPISSLPSKEGIGTMGKEAFKFIDYLHSAHASVWQILPLNPTNFGDSPYQSCCSDALNYYFIDLALLVKQKLLTKEEVESADLGGDVRRVDYGKQFNNKIKLLKTAFSRFDEKNEEFVKFVEEGAYSEFSTFMALKSKFKHKSWIEWDEPYRTYDEEVVSKYLKSHKKEYLFWQFTQFMFLKQWNALKEYANSKGVSIMGDIPLYVAYDSLEMWKYGKELFKVDDHKMPTVVAGVPPDAFSDDGQLWGNPVYNWEHMRTNGFKWWNHRINSCMQLVDILRIDHFRGFDRYYEIPYGNVNARIGAWCDGPKEDLFRDKLDYNIIAEDLGVIDDGVIRLMRNVGYPGMKILEFAFDGSPYNEHKPSNYTENFVCYTGTHDNMPLRQHIDDLGEEELARYKGDLVDQCRKLGMTADITSSAAMCKSIISLAFASKAYTVVIPMWDLLAMGGESRINLPSTVSTANWSWRFINKDFNKVLNAELKLMADMTGRSNY